MTTLHEFEIDDMRRDIERLNKQLAETLKLLWDSIDTGKNTQSEIERLKAENERLDKLLHDAITILRDFPTNSPLFRQAMDVYGRWCKYVDGDPI